jgi:hypothetical protein
MAKAIANNAKGLAHYGTVLVQWYVVYSHERRLNMMKYDDE